MTTLGLNAQVKLILHSQEADLRPAYKAEHPSTQAAFKEVRDLIMTWHAQGHLLAGVDSVRSDSTSVSAWLTCGPIYKLGQVLQGNLPDEIYDKLGPIRKSQFSYAELIKQQEQVLQWYENRGYPFAKVKFDSIKVSDHTLTLEWKITPERLFRLDSIVVVGDLKLKKTFLLKYLDLKQGMPYNEALLASISGKLRQLPFLKEKEGMVVRLTPRTNKLILTLDKKNASQFDGIVGILPNPITNKAVITGDLKLKLVNGVLRSGETIDVEWRRLQSQTQDVQVKLIYPYLAGTPIGSDASLKIYRKDTSFIDVNWSGGIQYYLKGLNHLKIFYKQRDSRLLGTSSLASIGGLPDYADITTRAYGIGCVVENLDYRFNPGKGVSFIFNMQTGNKVIQKNERLPASVYEGLLLRSLQFQGEFQFNAYIPLGGYHVFKIGLQGASIFGNSVIFKNELFRFGGLKTLRGFDEESLFASTYLIPTLEYRYRFSENSAILVFGEGAWYENNSNRNYTKDIPISVGAGINLDTKAGILTMHYAIGNQFGNGFDLRSGKIHIGLLALF